MKYVAPSVSETAFNCPHCDAYANQTWYSLEAISFTGDERHPKLLYSEDPSQMDLSGYEDDLTRQKISDLLEMNSEGFPVLDKMTAVKSSVRYRPYPLLNNFVAECFNCKKISILVYDDLVYPQRGQVPPANPDLSEDIRRDYNEAGSILDLSPRGSAALIRLAIQKLCKELGKSGRNLNSDIADLVRDGLDPAIQKSLDIVRVTGNNAVHPGHIDLRDDRKTAETLFRLLNFIADRMISRPKEIDEIYEGLPEDALQAIERRDSNNV